MGTVWETTAVTQARRAGGRGRGEGVEEGQGLGEERPARWYLGYSSTIRGLPPTWGRLGDGGGMVEEEMVE